MGFEPTHAFTRLPRFQHGLLSLLSNLPILTKIVYHKGKYLANKIQTIGKMIENERKWQNVLDFAIFCDRMIIVIVNRRWVSAKNWEKKVDFRGAG